MKVEYFFDFSCPYAYLGSSQFEAIREAGGEIELKPMLLGGVFRGIGAGDGPMATMSAAKATHNARDMSRWAEQFQIPLRMPPAHPMRSVRALRALLALPRDYWEPFVLEMYAAYWQRGEDITSPAVIVATAKTAGVPSDLCSKLEAANDDPSIKDELRARTDEAIERGVFGAPTFFVHSGDEPIMFWGQDRIHMVLEVLGGWQPGKGAPVLARGDAPKSGGEFDFYYDFSSPFAYLAATQVQRLADKSGATVHWRPMLLGAVFKTIGQVTVPLQAMPSAKQRYLAKDLAHWASYWQVPFRWPSRFPTNSVTALRLVLQAGDKAQSLSHELFAEYWSRDGDISDPDTLRGLVEDQGLDADALLAGCQDPKVKLALREATESAVAAGVFGAPTLVDKSGELYWGQDRLELALGCLSK